MTQELQLRLLPQVASDVTAIANDISRQQDIDIQRIKGVKILRRSIDARRGQAMVNVKVRAYIDEDMPTTGLLPTIDYQPVSGKRQAIVVGMGPAGLFAALRLITLGIKPIVLERGKNVIDRRKDVAKVTREGLIDPDSNYCFGEGGAGAYSDGKLYTRSKKRGSVEHILGIFVQHGANENILIDAHPHIGSDRLPVIIAAMRQTILDCGGEVHFQTRVTRLLASDGKVHGVQTASGEQYEGPVILATGHSARDVYTMLDQQGIELQAKGIAIGVRLEHPQHLIDKIQYHSPAGRGDYLPAAEYNFVTQVNGRGVYSFCMCPGGFIVPAASAPGQLVVNGMSPANRNSHWANSGIVVELHPDDLPDDFKQYGPLAMMRYQESLEQECYRQAGESQIAGAQRMKDFVDGKASRFIPPSSYLPGVQTSRLDLWLPPFIGKRLQKGLRAFGHAARGFLTNDAIVIGVETRTSSPLRIPRDDETLHHIALQGLYPCGEGAGYAGGIVSSAIDGERCAEALAQTEA